MKKQLKTYEYYNKRYDRFVISVLEEKEMEQKENEYNRGTVEFLMQEHIRIVIYSHEKQTILNNRDSTIKSWMEEDKKLDRQIALSPPASYLFCTKCNEQMDAIDYDIPKNDGRIRYLYKCSSDSCNSVRSGPSTIIRTLI